MPRTIFDPLARRILADRLARLTPDSPRRWGRMTAPQMICHLQDSLECATGSRPAKARRSLLASPFMRWLIIYVIPWPKGRARAVPEMLMTQPADWDADVRKLSASLEHAAARGPEGTWSRHPAFGAMPGRQYGHLIYRHFDHHLTQFGV